MHSEIEATAVANRIIDSIAALHSDLHLNIQICLFMMMYSARVYKLEKDNFFA